MNIYSRTDTRFYILCHRCYLKVIEPPYIHTLERSRVPDPIHLEHELIGKE